MVRIKQRHPMQSKSNIHDSNRHVDNRSSSYTYNTTNGIESPITPPPPPPFLSALSSPPFWSCDSAVRLATLFLPVTKIPYHHHRHQKESSSVYSGLPWLKNQANQLGQGMMDAAMGRRRWSDDARIFGFDEEQQQQQEEDEEDRPLAVAHRDLFSIHPDGILTLHRCCMTETLVRTREHGRAVERLELVTKQSDVAEWHVARYPDWAQVKQPLLLVKTISSSSKNSTTTTAAAAAHGWLSCAEITTYDINNMEQQPIWMTPGFSMHVFSGGDKKVVEEQLNEGMIPETTILDFKRDIPEPYNIRVNRVGKTSIAIASKEGRIEGEALDNALNELKGRSCEHPYSVHFVNIGYQDNLSSAMKTSFSPSTPTQYLGTSPGMRLSSSGDAPATTTSVDHQSPLSFEDAQLIHLGAEDATTATTYSPQAKRHNDTTMEEEEEAEEITFFSPDGDNEIASPHDSITGSTCSNEQQQPPHSDNDSSWWYIYIHHLLPCFWIFIIIVNTQELFRMITHITHMHDFLSFFDMTHQNETLDLHTHYYFLFPFALSVWFNHDRLWLLYSLLLLIFLIIPLFTMLLQCKMWITIMIGSW